jgi:hypothetical protein
MLFLLLLAIAMLVTVVVVVAVGVAAARSNQSDAQSLGWLVNLRSASGREFFPSTEAAQRLFGEIEEIGELQAQPAVGRPPRELVPARELKLSQDRRHVRLDRLR